MAQSPPPSDEFGLIRLYFSHGDTGQHWKSWFARPLGRGDTMSDTLAIAVLAFAALAASFLSAVTGFGGGASLLTVLVATYGIAEAIPILTVSQLAGNASRVWWNISGLYLLPVGHSAGD